AIEGVRCEYRTAYPVTLWPLEVSGAELQAPPFHPELPPSLVPHGTTVVLRLRLRCRGELTFADLALDKLRLCLFGGSAGRALVSGLYELIFHHTTHVAFLPFPYDRGARALPLLRAEHCLHPVGFEPDEGLLPYPSHSFPGYRLLTEFFTFPSKFWFVDLAGWRHVDRSRLGNEVEVVFLL